VAQKKDDGVAAVDQVAAVGAGVEDVEAQAGVDVVGTQQERVEGAVLGAAGRRAERARAGHGRLRCHDAHCASHVAHGRHSK